MKRRWEPFEDAVLRVQYPHMSTRLVAAMLERPVSSTYQRALAAGMHKAPEYLASPAACRLRPGDVRGAAFRFPPGHVPANKGLRRPGWAPGRMKETQFRKGERRGVALKLWKPVGTERASKDGYLERKVNDGLPLQRRWRGVHLIVWEAVNGPLPKGYAIRFKDGDKQNVALDNLECISRADLMRRNTYHRHPQPIPQLVQLRGALQRQINRREGNGKQDRGSSGTPVRNTGRSARQGSPDGHRAGEGRRGGGEGDRG